MRAPLVIASDLDRRDDAISAEAAAVIRQLVAQVAGKKRSLPHHNRLWALIRAAWKHWPSTHEIQCGSPEGLKEYLQLKAGFTTPHKIVRGHKTYIWFENRSIAFEKMSQDEFNLFAEKSEQIIEDVIGVPAEKLLIMDRAEV
jgi:hypothetical protein